MAQESYRADASDELQHAYFQAARVGNNEMLDAFYKAGLTPNVGDKKGYTALILAAYNGQVDTVDYLLNEVKVDACQEDNRGNTALMGALFKGNLSIVKTLIKTDCDVNKANSNGQTAIMFAALFDRQGAIEKLVEAGADIKIKDSAGNSLSDIALSQGNYDLVEKLETSEEGS